MTRVSARLFGSHEKINFCFRFEECTTKDNSALTGNHRILPYRPRINEQKTMKRKADPITEDRASKKPKIDIKLTTENYDYFSLLPDELLREVLSHLNDHHLRWARLIYQRLFRLVDMRHFSIGLIYNSEMTELIQVFGRYDKPIGLSFKKTNMLGTNISLLTRLTQLTQLDVGLEHQICIDSLINLQSLTALVSPINYQRHSQLTSLKTSHMPFLQPQIYPAQLEHLSVDFVISKTKDMVNPDPSRTKKCFEAMPNIKQLELLESEASTFMPGVECNLTGLESLVAGIAVTGLPANTMTALTILSRHMYGHINWDVSHLTNLRHLAVVTKRFMNHVTLSPFQSLESLIIRGMAVTTHLTQLISSKVTQLEVRFASKECIEHVTVFTNLRRLSIELGYEDKIDLARLSHLAQLTSIEVRGQSHWQSIENISACTKLTRLEELVLEQREQMGDDFLVLSSLTRLTLLTLKDLAPDVDLRKLTNLLALELQQSPLMRTIGLATSTNLTSLTFSKPLDDDCCLGLTSLQALTLSERMHDRSLQNISTLTRLTYLTGYTLESGACLTRLTRLQTLTMMADGGSKQIQKDLKQKLVYCHLFRYLYFEDDETFLDDSDYDDDE